MIETVADHLTLEQTDRVAVVTVNRPEARFGAPIARTLGNFAAPASLALMVATVGPVRAREMILTARLIAAPEAKTLGLVDEVHPLAALEGRTRELAARIAEHAPLTMAAVQEATSRSI